MRDETTTNLTDAELRDFQRLAGIMVPASPTHRVPGADDAAIFTDIVRSLGRDRAAVHTVLGQLHAATAGAFATMPAAAAEEVALALLAKRGPAVTGLGRAVLQCYYRDDRVVLALGLEPRAPFPKGHALEPGDWSLLDAVRGRPRMWRDVDGFGPVTGATRGER